MDSVSIAFELMRLELEAAVESLNSEGAKHFRASAYEQARTLIQKGEELQEFCEKVAQLETEWKASLAPVNARSEDPGSVEAAARTILSSSKSSKTALLVRFPDGEVIAERKAADTLVQVIKKSERSA